MDGVARRGHASHTLAEVTRPIDPPLHDVRKEDDNTREDCMSHTWQALGFVKILL